MKGLLFTGIMVTANGPKVLEYNVRYLEISLPQIHGAILLTVIDSGTPNANPCSPSSQKTPTS